MLFDFYAGTKVNLFGTNIDDDVKPLKRCLDSKRYNGKSSPIPKLFWMTNKILDPRRVQGQHYLSRMTGLQSRAFGFSYLEATDLLTVTRQLTLQNYAIKVK